MHLLHQNEIFNQSTSQTKINVWVKTSENILGMSKLQGISDSSKFSGKIFQFDFPYITIIMTTTTVAELLVFISNISKCLTSVYLFNIINTKILQKGKPK